MTYISFDTFTNNDALLFGLNVLEIIKEKNLKPVRIRVVIDNDLVFQYHMDTKVSDLWLNRKQKTIEQTHIASLDVFKNKEEYPNMLEDESYAVCGGAYPLMINHQYHGCFIISGLEHTQDHALIVEALERMKIK